MKEVEAGEGRRERREGRGGTEEDEFIWNLQKSSVSILEALGDGSCSFGIYKRPPAPGQR